MSIKATVGGTAYNGITKINAGGKEINLTETGTITTPTATKSIAANGTGIDVTNYAKVDVNVPSQGTTPTYQEKTVTANGTVTPDSGYDALSKVTVNVPEPTGTKSITANGTGIDVKNYASVNVNVPSSGITPSGTKQITGNGTYDVTNYASAVVNVPSSSLPDNVFEYEFTKDSDITVPYGTSAGSAVELLSLNPLDKADFRNFMSKYEGTNVFVVAEIEYLGEERDDIGSYPSYAICGKRYVNGAESNNFYVTEYSSGDRINQSIFFIIFHTSNKYVLFKALNNFDSSKTYVLPSGNYKATVTVHNG